MASLTMNFSRAATGDGTGTCDSDGWLDYENTGSDQSFANCTVNDIKITFDGICTNSSKSGARKLIVALEDSSNNYIQIYKDRDNELTLPEKYTRETQTVYATDDLSVLTGKTICDMQFECGDGEIFTFADGTCTMVFDYTVNPTITINSFTAKQNNKGEVTFSCKATLANASGSITYKITSGSTTLHSFTGSSGSTVTKTTNIASSLGYGQSYTFTLTSSYSNAPTVTKNASASFIYPSISAPTLSLSGTQLSWTASSFSSYLTGTTSYEIYKNGTKFASTSSTSYELSQSITEDWGAGDFAITVKAVGTELSNTAAGDTIYSSSSNSVTYTISTTRCTSPTSVKVNGGTSSVNTDSSSVTLTCSGASSGTNNAISAYYVQYQDSSDGTTWSTSDSSWTSMTNMTKAQATSGYSAASPAMGKYRKYRIKTKGSVSGYDATTWKESPVVYRIVQTPCNPPSAVYTDKTLSYNPVNLRWEGASDGTNNPIAGYLVQRCESEDGKTFSNWSSPGTTVNASPMQVDPSSTIGHYSKFRVRALSNLGDNYHSAWTESNALRKNMAPFDSLTDPNLKAQDTKIKAIHMTELQRRINDLLLFNGKEAFLFTDIIAGKTLLTGWTSHVAEIRDAIDELGIDHEAWIAITENRPRVDVMNQLRNIAVVKDS